MGEKGRSGVRYIYYEVYTTTHKNGSVTEYAWRRRIGEHFKGKIILDAGHQTSWFDD
jgi:hypothetical protein